MQLQGPRRTFLARPFWRDYVLAYVLVGLGFVLTSPVAPVHRGVGVAIVVCGAVVFLCAVGSSIHSTWRAGSRVPSGPVRSSGDLRGSSRPPADVPIIDRSALVDALQRRLPDVLVTSETINTDYGSWEIAVRDGQHRVNIAWGPLSGFGATDLDNIRDDITPFLSIDWPMENTEAAAEFFVRVVRGCI